MRRKSTDGNGPRPIPVSPWLGAAIGLTILSMASTAMAIGAGLALTQATCRGK